jgi:predicted ATPase/class 3 adenylate cyclase
VTETSASPPPTRPPHGTVTFLFTDIEGSTRLLQRLRDDYGRVLTVHQELLRAVFARCQGHEVGTQGDAFFVAFSSAKDAAVAAVDAQRALLAYDWPHGTPVLVRMGLHTGEPVVIDNDYVGIDVHRAARICDASHGGQVVTSDATRRLLEDQLEGVTFKDLGEHRLKDLERAEHIWQLVAEGLPTEFPRLRSARPPTNVPAHVGRLIGREEAAEELRAMLFQDGERLVTLSGPGGIGKTRLSAAVAAAALDHFSDGVFFVDLSTLHSAELVASQVAQALPTSRDGDRAPVTTVVEYIGDKKILLVLDNFEQVIAGATTVSRMLQSCPNLTLLVTSRIVLSIQGEREYPLPPLALPDQLTSAEVARSEAGQLFVDRARAVRPTFALTDEHASTIAEICKLLDGLPLAIELAAARVKLLSPLQILERLDDRLRLLTGGARDSPMRHRGLRTTIDWSYDLLTGEEQGFFRDLAVFSGGATLEAAEHIMHGRSDPLDSLTALVNHSLVRQREDPSGEVRFMMLQTISDYALELLRDHAGEAELRDRHARYYLDLAEGTLQDSVDQAAALARVAGEHDNMRAALTWLLQQADNGRIADGVLALQLASALGRFWYRHGHAVEGAAWLERALKTPDGAPEALRARGLRMLGVLMELQRRFDRANELFEEALASFRQRGDRAGEAACLNSLGIVARSQGHFEAAQELMSASVMIRRKIGDAEIPAALSNLGIVYLDQGDLHRAEQLFDEAIGLDRSRGDAWGAACTRIGVGVVSLERGNVAASRSTLQDALRELNELGDLDAAAECIEALAGVAAREGLMTRAARLAGATDSLRRDLGIPRAPPDSARIERWLEGAIAELGDDAFRSAWAEGAQMTADQAVNHALERSTGLSGAEVRTAIHD